MIKISKTSKLGCRSWSLQALDTCPASIDFITGKFVPACQGCYATEGNYRFANVREAREHNKQDWKRTGWVVDMVTLLDADRYFRWFDSGDMYSIGLAKKILEVMKLTPWTRHWMPTRMHKFAKFKKVISEMNTLDNVVVRLSSDSVTGGIIDGETTSTIVPTSYAPTTAFICRAYDNGGKCGTCRSCWDKDTAVIAYVAHGQKMKQVLSHEITK
tara:strand:- start:5169 stop:5813 length:645 start_codon:yes stop_codon:yes gene_type:complete